MLKGVFILTLCLSVLGMHVYMCCHVNVWCLRRPEWGISCSATGVTENFKTLPDCYLLKWSS